MRLLFQCETQQQTSNYVAVKIDTISKVLIILSESNGIEITRTELFK